MVIDSNVPKKYSDCFLYKNNLTDILISKYINRGSIIEKDDPRFSGVMNSFKNSYPKWLYRFINMPDVMFMVPDKSTPVPKSFNGFSCVNKSPKGGKSSVIAIINSSLLDAHMKSNKMVLSSTTETVVEGYIISAFNSYIYNKNPRVFNRNSIIITAGSEAFSRLVSHILHYLYKVKAMPRAASEVEVYSKMYYFVNLLGLNVDRAYKLATKATGLSPAELNAMNADDESLYENIDKFVTNGLATIGVCSNLTTSLFVEKWISMYGNGTEFAMELLPAFLTMFTNQYVSSYATNIKVLQNLMGKRNPVAAEVMSIGGKLYG